MRFKFSITLHDDDHQQSLFQLMKQKGIQSSNNRNKSHVVRAKDIICKECCCFGMDLFSRSTLMFEY